MKGHYSKQELKQFVNGNYSLNKIVEISQHTVHCRTCRESINEISTIFFEELPFEAPQSAPTNESHFSDDEISAFLRADSSVDRRLEMSVHFRNCLNCKAKLFSQDPEILKQTIANILIEEAAERKNSSGGLFTVVSFGTMAALLFGLLFFISLSKNKSNILVTQAEVIYVDNAQHSAGNNSENTISYPNVENSSISNIQNLKDKANKSKSVSNKVITKSYTSKTSINQKSSKPVKNLILTSTRSSSNSAVCFENHPLNIISPYYEVITEIQPSFYWKAIPNASSYTIYISDASQVLIEEFETGKETFYAAKTSLKPNIQYKWKVIAKLNDGKIVYSESVHFSVGKTDYKYSHKKNEIINQNRCP